MLSSWCTTGFCHKIEHPITSCSGRAIAPRPFRPLLHLLRSSRPIWRPLTLTLMPHAECKRLSQFLPLALVLIRESDQEGIPPKFSREVEMLSSKSVGSDGRGFVPRFQPCFYRRYGERTWSFGGELTLQWNSSATNTSSCAFPSHRICFSDSRDWGVEGWPSRCTVFGGAF